MKKVKKLKGDDISDLLSTTEALAYLETQKDYDDDRETFLKRFENGTIQLNSDLKTLKNRAVETNNAVDWSNFYKGVGAEMAVDTFMTKKRMCVRHTSQHKVTQRKEL